VVVFGSLPGLPCHGNPIRLAAQATKGIDEIAMTTRIDERAVVMLTVDLDQRLPYRAQQLHTDGHVIDEGAGAAICGLNATQNERAIGLKSIVGKELQHRMIGRRIEGRGDLALARPVAHQRRVATAADGESEGIEQDRFSSAGLTCEHAKSWAEFEIESVDQNDVADRQSGKHGG